MKSKIFLIAIIGMFILTSCGTSNYLGCPAYSSTQTTMKKYGKKSYTKYVKNAKVKKNKIW